ncbi:hypothetical protein Tco_1110177 [Tanacetum coccineum]|uniref:Uncharacterized protein n=1 Tax=Tanacetum coccineum TaxID=301880 RepID=A0ABQ5IIC3_9ASTR
MEGSVGHLFNGLRLEKLSLIGPESVIKKLTDNVVLKGELKAREIIKRPMLKLDAKPMEFEVGDRVMLQESTMKGVIHIGIKGKTCNTRYDKPFEIFERSDPVANDIRNRGGIMDRKKLLQIKEMADQDTPPPTITAMKIPIIKKGEYDIWSMRMRQYICHTYHNLWDIIVNGDLEDEATPSGEQSSPPVPKTAKQLAARRNQERIKSILLLAIPDEYLLSFHNCS